MPVETLQKVFKTLTDPTRMRVLFLLEREELAVQELVQILEVAQSTVSRHLGILREAGLLQDRRDGTSIYYRFAQPADSRWSQTWELARSELADDSVTTRDLANLELVLRQREVGSRRWFEEVAPEWDNIRQVFNDEVHRARAITRLIPRDLCVADIGTGTGILARELAEAGVRVLAIDRSQQMIDTARAKCGEALADRVEFRCGEANALPVSDGEVDAAMAHMVLHYLASPAEALQEMARIVRPGGRIVVVDFVQHDNEWMKQELGVLWQGFSLDAVLRWLGEAGLRDAQIEVDEQPRRGGVDLPHTFVAVARRPLDTEIEGAGT
ncbi:MAG: metalloregulator ArsR/SmtB family transcription factor [Planctomycetota bacterium]|nr:metalloregulator ArsR/SmtB family transcription factor [Planctomycetota bacterium]